MRRPGVESIAEAYSRHSDRYDSVLRPVLGPMAEQVARLAKLGGGELALDLATGTGLIARGLGRFRGSVVGVDISLGMLRRAQRQAGQEIRFVVGDALHLPFQDQCFDLVTCGVSLSHFPDVSMALAEVRRALRPGGRFVTSAWGTKGVNPSKEAAVEIRNRYLAAREATFGCEFGEEAWADPGKGSEVLRQAGFRDVRVESADISGEYADHSQAIEAASAWPLTRYRIAQLSPEDQETLRAETEAAIRHVKDLRWRSEVHYYQARIAETV